MWEQIRSAIPLFVIFTGLGMAVILLTRQPDTPDLTATPTPASMAPDTRRALMDLAAERATALNACETAYNTGDYNATTDICTAAAETLPDNDTILMVRGQAFEQQGVLREAIEDYGTITNRAAPGSDLYNAARDRLDALTEQP